MSEVKTKKRSVVKYLALSFFLGVGTLVVIGSLCSEDREARRQREAKERVDEVLYEVRHPYDSEEAKMLGIVQDIQKSFKG